MSVNARHIEDIGNDIAQGTVAVELLRPASVLGIRMATEVGARPPEGRGAVGGRRRARHASSPAAPPRPATLVLVAPSLVLAITANLFAQHAVAAIAFWIRDAGSVWFLYMKARVHPRRDDHPARAAARRARSASRDAPAVPRRWPTRRPASRPGIWEPVLLVEQLFWIGVLAVVATAAFRAGERRLQVVGG